MTSSVATAAVRVRTVLARAGAAHIAADNVAPGACRVRHLMPDGTLAITAERAAGIAKLAPGATGVLELLDRTPVPECDSVRALVWIRGRITPAPQSDIRHALSTIAETNPDPGLLDVGHRDRLFLLAVDSIVFADSGGAEQVGLDAVRSAHPDPFSRTEAAWVRHLNRHHPEMVERLRMRLPRRMRSGRIQVLGLDRFGLQVRTEGPQDSWEFHVPFFAPVDDDDALCRALMALMACPFSHGLRART